MPVHVRALAIQGQAARKPEAHWQAGSDSASYLPRPCQREPGRRASVSLRLRADAGWKNYRSFLSLSYSQWHIGTVSMMVSGDLELLGCVVGKGPALESWQSLGQCYLARVGLSASLHGRFGR